MKRQLVLSMSIIAFSAGNAFATDDGARSCNGLPSHAQLRQIMQYAITVPTGNNRGFNLNMWATVVNRDAFVCAVAFTGGNRGDQWPGSRVISAQKANTANAFSLDGLALSTANLYGLVQPGKSLYGLQHSNPVDTDVAYKGPTQLYGTAVDPMVGNKIGGVNVFGGGLALYRGGQVIGAIGVSGDTSCADHNIAWAARNRLVTNYGFSAPPTNDNIVYNLDNHPVCLGGETAP